MSILNLAGYRFIALTDLVSLRQDLNVLCKSLELKGTLLLSPEGINITLAGTPTAISHFKNYLQTLAAFENMEFHHTYSAIQPFKRLKIKIKKEIITLRQPEINPEKNRAPAISPLVFKQWLDEDREITILDTRNNYEMAMGAFKNAAHLNLENFEQFKEAINQLDRKQTFVLCCTGGIRCEKAALHMLAAGFSEVQQLEGGILGYFAQVGSAHYQGSCFVFDERVAVNPDLTPYQADNPSS